MRVERNVGQHHARISDQCDLANRHVYFPDLSLIVIDPKNRSGGLSR